MGHEGGTPGRRRGRPGPPAPGAGPGGQRARPRPLGGALGPAPSPPARGPGAPAPFRCPAGVPPGQVTGLGRQRRRPRVDPRGRDAARASCYLRTAGRRPGPRRRSPLRPQVTPTTVVSPVRLRPLRPRTSGVGGLGNHRDRPGSRTEGHRAALRPRHRGERARNRARAAAPVTLGPGPC